MSWQSLSNLHKRLILALVGLLLLTLLLNFALTLWVPIYIQNLLLHPDGSYLSAILLKHHLKNEHVHTAEWYGTYIPQVLTRILGLLYVVTSVVLILVTIGRGHLRRFWNHPSTAFNLGIVRIAILYDVITYDMFSSSLDILKLSPEGMSAPVGYGWLRAYLPPPEWLLVDLISCYKVFAWMALFGLFTRVALPLLAVVSFVVMIFPHFVGKMDHYHHLWLAIFFLSMSPCGDALSLDSLIRRFRGFKIDAFRLSRLYGRPLVYIWMMMGAIYFFPGFWKFAASGWEWAFSDNVVLKILAKVYETGVEPPIPLYNYPTLAKMGGLATLILELGFPLAMIFPLTRLLFAFGGLGFHESNYRIVQIRFVSIEWFYASFGNWSRWLGLESKNKPELQVTFPKWKTVSCLFMVAGLWGAGITAIESWPWANYPTFAPIEQRFINSIEMRLTLSDGTKQVVLLQEDPTLIHAYDNRTRLRSFLNLVMSTPDETNRVAMLRSLYQQWLGANPNVVVSHVDFWQIEVPLLPRHLPPVPYKSIGQF